MDNISVEIVEDYIRSLNVIKKNNFKLFDIYNFPSELEKVWVICYESFSGPDCSTSSNMSKNWILLDVKKFPPDKCQTLYNKKLKIINYLYSVSDLGTPNYYCKSMVLEILFAFFLVIILIFYVFIKFHNFLKLIFLYSLLYFYPHDLKHVI